MIENNEGIWFLNNKVDDNTIDLILTDPPYITSRKTGMDTHSKKVKTAEENNTYIKTEADWEKWKANKENIYSEKQKENYLKYGSIYGKKYAVVTDYGDWDSQFTMESLEEFIKLYYKKLKNGGTCIIFFDLWKISFLKELLEKHKFKQLRMIEWIKTNPQPLNSSTNYLTNCREIAIVCVKGSKPTFNSKYDNGIYYHPLQGGKDRFHPTQKSLDLFKTLMEKHSNEGDTVLDTFLGSGTTAVACKEMKRRCIGCEVSEEFFEKLQKRLV